MYPEDDLLPISALQHLLYCPRQCALIHVERLWAENRFTVEGRHLHQRADAGKGESRRPRKGRGGGDAADDPAGRGRIARGLPLRSLALGLFGKADIVEFLPPAPPTPDAPPDNRHLSRPFPVEYKRGRPKSHDADRVQLCAQALCLEEMFAAPVPAGALFYGKTRRRVDVPFDDALRALTRDTIGRLRTMVATGTTPPPVYDCRKCGQCSLKDLCLPEAPAGAARYLTRALAAAATGPASD